jgi:elongation factor Ts
MAEITAADVKKLRDATGAGMMDAKKALVEADGDFDLAAENLRIKGVAKMAARGSERTASNGLVAVEGNSMIELACETDFVAKGAEFQDLAAEIAGKVASAGAADTDAALEVTLDDGRTVSTAIAELSAKIGEKFELRRAVTLPGQTTAYLHKRASDLPAQVGVLIAYEGGNADAARAAAMQVAALRAQYVSRDEVPADVVANEQRIAEATAREEGKPDAALPKIIEGRVNGFYKEVVLLEQSSVQDSKKTVKAMLDEAGVTITRFARFEVGQA